MDVVGTAGWLAALAARPDGGSPLPAEEALGLVSALARRLADEHAAGTVHGAALPPALQAPEVLAGGAPTPVSDVYALVAGLFTMLAGRPPHVAEGEDDVPAGALLARRAGLPDEVPGLLAPVTALLRRGLATDPAERPQDADSLAAALDDCAGLVDYTRRRELGQKYRPRPVTPRPAADAPLAPADAASGPVTPVDPLPVLARGRRSRRTAVLVAVLAVVAAVLVLLVPGLGGTTPSPGATPGPQSSVEVGPAVGTSPTGAPGATTAPVPAGGSASASVPGSTARTAPAAASTPGATTRGTRPAAGGGASSVPAVATAPPSSTTSTVSDPTVPPVVPPTRATVPGMTETVDPPPPVA